MAAPMKRGSDFDSQIPAKVALRPISDEKLCKFLKWCNTHQFNISPKVSVERERSCARYGMIAVEDIVAGETLFHIPRKCLLSPENCGIAELLQPIQQEVPESRWLPLLLALIYEYNNPQSAWQPYLQLMPAITDLDLPMFWDSNERQELLKGTGVDDAVTQDLYLMEKDFSTKALPFMQKHSHLFSVACQDFQLYQRMVAFVMAYSFTEPKGSTSVQENVKDDECEEEEEGVSPPPLMVPLADILNHVSENNAALTFHKEELRMVSTREIHKGEEVFNTYGELANKHLLHMYGFAECYPDNIFDTVEIPVAIVTEVAEKECKNKELLASKLHFLQEQDLHQAGDSYVIGKEGVLTDDELQAVMKVLVMSEEEFKEHAEKEGWSDAESDNEDDVGLLSFVRIPALPDTWKYILYRCAESCLSTLARNAQEDELAMESKGHALTSRRRYALYVRYGQRKLLNQLLDACRL